jgi:lipopolysaccharide/colanic/teichoic acid biosynthesis glycosyltransferase
MYSILLKRLIDLILALLALPFLLLSFVLLAPIIYLTDRGPVFYNATRMGKNGQAFRMFKFRSMRMNAPDLRNADGSTYNSEDDPRVTRIGKIMRKTSLDELPQLVNVLVGEMSLVGPRPTLMIENYHEMDEQLKKRYLVRPGITGYTQAYFRNSIGQNEKFACDAYYAENLSFMLDLKVLLKTVLVVLKREHVFVGSPAANSNSSQS